MTPHIIKKSCQNLVVQILLFKNVSVVHIIQSIHVFVLLG